MQTIVVRGSAQLQEIINQLTSYNNQFQAKVNEMCNEQRRLDGMWDGEANTEFNRVFNEDRRQFTEFHAAITEYINKLRNIKENYENAETNNRRIASTRNG